MPILWRDPYQYSMNNISKYKLFYLRLIEEIISFNHIKYTNVLNLKNKLLKLIINKNIVFIHLSISISRNISYQLQHIPGTEYCLSELESFHCYAGVNQNDLEALASICKSIKKFTFDNMHYCSDNSGIIKLIEVQQKLNNVNFIGDSYNRKDDKSFYKSIEKSLIKHVDTVQYLKISWTPVTRVLSFFVNLISLDIDSSYSNMAYWSNFENVTFSVLKILKVRRVPSNFLTTLSKSTTENLSEICMHYDGIDSKIIFKTIYQKCLNLKYLQLSFVENNNLLIPELENLLIYCKLLNRLTIEVMNDTFDTFNWDKLFMMLA
ncbi:hypothetical protein RclHR1_00640033 [Rhizophagus clarus]|uniref:F-box domain-containing protein n=1 Tax=Rhizophagus clarus TaxID=94130 RepID=A0A2Z6S4G4_9GLOM|nr:hypothetical protein RclHR1_00640033 [Rhizophagus clarus]